MKYIVMEIPGDNVPIIEEAAAKMANEVGISVNAVWVQGERPPGDPVLQQAAIRWCNQKWSKQP